jgi:prevent-host-death family protein
MRTVNIHEAKTHRSKLVDDASRGKEVIIAKAGKPMARLVPLASSRKPRKLGVLAGEFTTPEDFDAPLPEEVIALFEGREGDAPAR